MSSADIIERSLAIGGSAQNGLCKLIVEREPSFKYLDINLGPGEKIIRIEINLDGTLAVELFNHPNVTFSDSF